MEINLKTILDVFDSVISGKMTRDEADRWAWELRKKDECDELIYMPPSDRERIWEGIRYLHGIDMPMPDAPLGTYLYSIEDLKAFKKSLL